MPARELRTTFDENAELYLRARPTYPPELIEGLAELAGLGPGARIAEIGPGTGQATAALVARGASVVAVELGAGLASVLRSEIAGAAVEVVVAAFEEWPLPAQRFDAVCAFTAWHWLAPGIRTTKAAAALTDDGTLATVTTSHVGGGTAAFFTAVQDCYERWDPATPPRLRLPAAAAVPAAVDEVDSSPLFLPARRRRYEQDITYTTSGYLDLLRTYSGHRTLSADRRESLLACISTLIDRRYGGTIVKRYLYELRVARKRPSRPVGSPSAPHR